VNKLLLSDRKKLVDKYYDWLQMNPQVKDEPLNFLGWCCIEDILNIDKSKDLIKQ
jgi:dienelactone hydrolase